MTNCSTASRSADSLSVRWNTEDTVVWLQPQSRRQDHSSDNEPARQLFLKFTASLSLGALLTFGSAGAALAPSKARAAAPNPSEPNESVTAAGRALEAIKIELPPEIVVSLPKAQVSLPGVDLVAAAPIEVAVPGCTTNRVVSDADLPLGSARVAALDPSSAATAEAEQASSRDPNEMLEFDEMRVPRWIVETILRASEVTGVDPVYMMALADKESSFLPDRKARTSSAEGLFQFLSNTWLEVIQRFGARHGLTAEAEAIQTVNGQLTVEDGAMKDHILDLRRDPYLSALMAAEMKKRDRELIERRLGRTISRSEFYLAHFFGVNSASKFMSLLDDKPKQSAPRVFPAAARANKSLFFTKSGKKTRQLTVAEVFSKIDEMIDKRLDRYEDVQVVATASADASL
jgi:hypothetical protein